ncbi:MAG: methionine--tRNA ligase [Candidatus Binataceae bacterium]
MAERIHITTAIHYSNGPPHLGHAYEAIAADAFARHYKRKLGADNVTFVTGTDEHGQKNRDAAAKAGLSPKEFVDRTSALFKETFALLEIDYTKFVRTTDDAHKEFVRWMLKRTHDAGDIYPKDYEGLYCVGCERFYTEKELVNGTVCPVHNTPTETIRERNYFLNLEKFRAKILERINGQADFIRPERYRNEALRMLAEPLEDLCISRPKSRLDWGIELPFDNKYVTYVWYDAFCAYFSEVPGPNLDALKQTIPVTQHFIGKDILKTHAVYWPAILLAAGLPIYGHLNVHGFLNFGGARLSKSAGNIVDPAELAKKYGSDVLRYFVLREFVYGLDGDFTEDRIVERYNADLANNLGNLVSRVLTMAQNYFGGDVNAGAAALTDEEKLFPGFSATFFAERVGEKIEVLRFGKEIEEINSKTALEQIWIALDVANRDIVRTSPFTLAKDPAKLPQVGWFLAQLLWRLGVISGALEPFMPNTARKLFELLKVDAATVGNVFEQGHRVKPPIPLFPRIEKPK